MSADGGRKRGPEASAGGAPSTDRQPAGGGRRWSTRLFRSELWLIFGRRRNWVGLAVLCSVPILINIATKVSAPASGGPDFFVNITSNGLFAALASLVLELPLFLPVAVAAISADAIAGEANLGTLRYLLAVPAAAPGCWP